MKVVGPGSLFGQSCGTPDRISAGIRLTVTMHCVSMKLNELRTAYRNGRRGHVVNVYDVIDRTGKYTHVNDREHNITGLMMSHVS